MDHTTPWTLFRRLGTKRFHPLQKGDPRKPRNLEHTSRGRTFLLYTQKDQQCFHVRLGDPCPSTPCCNAFKSITYLRHRHHHAVARSADRSAQHHSYRLARTVGEENIVWVRAVSVTPLDEIANLVHNTKYVSANMKSHAGWSCSCWFRRTLLLV